MPPASGKCSPRTGRIAPTKRGCCPTKHPSRHAAYQQNGKPFRSCIGRACRLWSEDDVNGRGFSRRKRGRSLSPKGARLISRPVLRVYSHPHDAFMALRGKGGIPGFRLWVRIPPSSYAYWIFLLPSHIWSAFGRGFRYANHGWVLRYSGSCWSLRLILRMGGTICLMSPSSFGAMP